MEVFRNLVKAFLVNLDRNPDRLAFMDRQLRRLGIDYERVPAVDGKKLCEEEKKVAVNRVRSFFAVNRMLLDGEIGCALSHLSIYRRMRNDHLECALVFEDDVKLEDDFIDICKKALEFVDVNRPQVVLFSAPKNEKNPRSRNGIVKSQESFWCTDAYLITLPAAGIIIKDNYPVSVYADAWKRWERYYGMELYRIYPEVAHQDRVAYKTVIESAAYRPAFLKKFYFKLFGWWLNPVVNRLWLSR